MNCVRCGAQLWQGSNTCPKCGAQNPQSPPHNRNTAASSPPRPVPGGPGVRQGPPPGAKAPRKAWEPPVVLLIGLMLLNLPTGIVALLNRGNLVAANRQGDLKLAGHCSKINITCFVAAIVLGVFSFLVFLISFVLMRAG